MDVDDVITLLDYTKENDEEIYRELDRRFRKVNELLDEIFNVVCEIKYQNKASIETNIDDNKENVPFL